jgi:hypothetical protein
MHTHTYTNGIIEAVGYFTMKPFAVNNSAIIKAKHWVRVFRCEINGYVFLLLIIMDILYILSLKTSLLDLLSHVTEKFMNMKGREIEWMGEVR